MDAIEITSKTDKFGHLKIDYPLNISEKKVRILILLENNDSDEITEKQWIKSVSNNSVFDFLCDPDEDIYSLNDGEVFND